MRHTVASHNRGINVIDINDSSSIIQGHINPSKMAVFRQYPLRNCLELFIRPSADQFLGEVDMHFLRSAFRTGSDTSETSVMASTDPTAAIAKKAFRVGDPIATDERH